MAPDSFSNLCGSVFVLLYFIPVLLTFEFAPVPCSLSPLFVFQYMFQLVMAKTLYGMNIYVSMDFAPGHSCRNAEY